MKSLIGALIAIAVMAPAVGQDVRPSLRLDVHHYDIDIKIVPEDAYLEGRATISFTVLEDSVSIPFALNSRLSLIDVVDENEMKNRTRWSFEHS